MNAEPNDSTTPIPPKSNAWRIFAGVLAGLLALFIGYSCYIGFHESEAQETILLGQSRLAAGGPASWRFLVRNRTNGRAIAKAKIGLKLRNDREVIALGTFTTGKDGTIADAVALPDLAAGDYSLVIEVRSRLGRDQIERKVQIANPAQILLTTDKPLYQPGQIIHLRGLVCNSRTHQPLAAQPVMFEISDAKGNKVLKEEMAASPFGIVSTDFLLASELNQGHFDIRASSGFAAAERRVEVKSYVMPKFKATLTTEKSFYHPGEVVNGWVQAAYFFGKPAAGASVELNAKANAGQTVAVAAAKGMTDDSGKVPFQSLLPYN